MIAVTLTFVASTPHSDVCGPRSVGPAAPGPPGQPGVPSLGAGAWKPWTAGVAVIAAFGLALAGRATVSTATGDGVDALLGGALVVLTAAPIALAVLLANLHGRPTAHDFGFHRPPLRRAISLATVVWFALTALTVLWVTALGLDGEEGQALTDRLGTNETLSIVILIVVITIIGPLQEEFLFRGYIFRALRNRQGVWPAAITSGALFGATHVGWVPIALIVPVIVFGIGMCLLYHWTGSLYPGIAVHAFGNAIPLGAALHWTWQTPLLIVGSTLAALTIAWLLALVIGDGGTSPKR